MYLRGLQAFKNLIYKIPLLFVNFSEYNFSFCT